MCFQITPLVETLTTLITWMIFYSCVGCHMSLQINPMAETLTTLITWMIFHSNVGWQMPYQLTPVAEILTTLITWIIFLLCDFKLLTSWVFWSQFLQLLLQKYMIYLMWALMCVFKVSSSLTWLLQSCSWLSLIRQLPLSFFRWKFYSLMECSSIFTSE